MVRAVLVLCALARLGHADCARDKHLPIARGSIVVDGELDDATWATACFATDFVQKVPVYGAAPTHPVRVAVAIDDTTLYVGARMWSANADDIGDAVTQRDDTQQAERFIVSLDPSHTKRLAYSFAVTAAGVRADWIHGDDSEGDRDMSWNPVWIAKSRILPDGWSAELAIPLSQLRLPRTPAASWGINFNWYIPGRNEDVFWRAVPRDRTAWASMFGELDALPPVHPGINLELMPYAATHFTIDGAPSGALAHHFDAGFSLGLDAKLRPLPDFTITGTIDPDFGQVDADPAFVNLTAYEVTLQEKRPFFVENNRMFADGNPEAFYSRRIGGLPHILPSADSIVLPQQVRILGAIAAGGYLTPHTQLATIIALTERTEADAIVAGQHTSLVVSPLTAWAAVRLERQLGASLFGATASIVERRLDGTGLEGLLARTAATGQVDGVLRTDDGELELDPFLGYSALFGTPAAITTIATDEAHYFQRPDQPHVHVDPNARSMVGWLGGVFAQKRAGLYHGETALIFESPGFDLNDLGSLATTDDITAELTVSRNQTAASKHVNSWSIGATARDQWNFGLVRFPALFKAFGDVTFANFYNAGGEAQFVSAGDVDDLTRGGPLMRVGWSGHASVHASTPNGRAQQVSASLTLRASDTLDQGVIAGLDVITRVTPSLRLDIAPSLTIDETHRQYVATVTDAGGGADTYGARYVFGHLHQKQAALELRATWSLSPDLVLTLYAQPFAAVGRYDAIGELVAAGSDQVRWYDSTAHVDDTRYITDGTTMFSVSEPDFSVASLRSTAVLRWEPSPGSTVFLVWQQQRGGSSVPVAQPLHSTTSDIFTQSAIHTIAIKMSWWFG